MTLKKRVVLWHFLILGMIVVLGSTTGCVIQKEHPVASFSLGYVTILENGIWEGRLRSEDGKEKVLFAFTPAQTVEQDYSLTPAHFFAFGKG